MGAVIRQACRDFHAEKRMEEMVARKYGLKLAGTYRNS
jgi:hypothetical protein